MLYDSLHNEKSRRTAKLDSRYTGPYKVLRQVKDEIEGRHLALGAIKFLLVERLKIFVGTEEEAFKLAMEDAAPYPVPNRHAVRSFYVRIYKQARVLQQLWRNGVVLGNPSRDGRLKTQLQRAQEPAHEHHAHPRLLSSDQLIPLALRGGTLDHPFDPGQKSPLVVLLLGS